MADLICPTCKEPLEKDKDGRWFCPNCSRRECPTCGRVMKRSGAGRYVCSLHGEWLEKEPDERQEQEPTVKPGSDYDPDPYRHDKTIDSQIREYGPGSNGVGRVRKKGHKHKPDPWREV